MRRLLFVVNHAGFFLSHRLALAVAARGAGYDVHVATPASKYVPRIDAAGFPWHPIRLARSGRDPTRELRTLLDLASLYRRLRPTLLHHVTIKPVLYGTAVARLTGVRAVVNAPGGAGHVFAENTRGLSMLRTVVGGAYWLALRHPRMRVIFQNREHRALFVDRRWVRPEETVLIPGSGVDVAAFTPGARSADDTPVVVFPARMLWTKGLREFVDAAARLRREGVPARFVLVGDPDPDNLASATEREIRAWEREGRVEYWGRREDMPDVLRRADVACLPSYSEGLPKSLLEAAAAGLPIVTTDIPGCRDVVRDGHNGFLVPVGDAGAVAAALRRVLGDASLRARLGSAGRERAVHEFALERVVDAHLSLYEELTEA